MTIIARDERQAAADLKDDRVKPFYAAPPSADGRSSRLLLLSYHFPPGQSAGALRWQRLAKYAAQWGWCLDVVTRDPSQLGKGDVSRLDDLPPGTRVYGVPRDSPWLDRLTSRGWRVVRTVRKVFARRVPQSSQQTLAPSRAAPESLGREEIGRLPRETRDLTRAYHAWREFAKDARWADAAADVGLALAREEGYEAVISCGPPHMVHKGARKVARRIGAPFVVDMRDPWSLVQRLPESVASGVWLQLARRHERQVVRDAALVVANTEPARSALQVRYPDVANRIVAVMNGYDDDPLPAVQKRDRFTIAYAGSIYLDRDPAVLFQAAALTIKDLRLSRDDFRIEFMGYVRSFNGQSVQQIAAAHGLDGYLEVHPPGPRSAAMAFLGAATLLVSLPQDSDLAIPSKIYEYMRHDAWILAMASADSATGQLLAGTQANVVTNNVEAVASVLRSRVLAYRAGERPEPLARDRRLSRAFQADILFRKLEEVVPGPRGDRVRDDTVDAPVFGAS